MVRDEEKHGNGEPVRSEDGAQTGLCCLPAWRGVRGVAMVGILIVDWHGGRLIRRSPGLSFAAAPLVDFSLGGLTF